MFSSSSTIGIIGLGYVGMPLAAALAGKGLRVTGYDIDARRVERFLTQLHRETDVLGVRFDNVPNAGFFRKFLGVFLEV